MREVEPGGDAKSGTSQSGTVAPSNEPASSKKAEVIATNTQAAQAYVASVAVPGAPKQQVPNKKIALSESVDPRKAPTTPDLKRAAQTIAAELRQERDKTSTAKPKAEPEPEPKSARKAAPEKGASKSEPKPKSEPKKDPYAFPAKKAPVNEAPPDSQISAIRRGAGYAPSRAMSPTGTPVDVRQSGQRGDAIPRSTPARGLRISRPPPAPSTEAQETPAQRRIRLLLTAIFIMLVLLAGYFFFGRALSTGNGAAPGAGTTSAPPQ